MKKQMVALLAGAMMMLATSAWAVPISGTISFTGNVALTGTPVGGNQFTDATGIQFVRAYTDQFGSDGIYASIMDRTSVTYTDFTFRPGLPGAVAPLWTITQGGETYSFDMASISTTSTTSSLSLHGLGFLKASGITDYDITEGIWDFSTQDGVFGKLSFSASSAPVPEPGTMVLLGFGMLGLAVYGKRRMNKEA